MAKVRTFISFDYDNDKDIKTLLAGQAENPDSPFDITDLSIKEPLSGDWKEKVRSRIRRVDLVIVICGLHTGQATGVSIELNIAQEERKPYFLLSGRTEQRCVKPRSALQSDKLYKWKWDNLKRLISGAR